MNIEHSNILFLGLLLLSGLFAGQIASKIGMPRVAAYVLVGAIYSHEFLGYYFPTSSEDWSQPLTHIALGIIAFIIGGSITLGQLQRVGNIKCDHHARWGCDSSRA
jgi:Kef-type K+ transport system membrane component KefB